MSILINLLAIFGALSLASMALSFLFGDWKVNRATKKVIDELESIREVQDLKNVHPTLINYLLAIKMSIPDNKGDVNMALRRIAALAIAAIVDHDNG